MANRFVRSLRLPLHPSSFSPGGSSRWTNRDLDPIPRQRRKWGPWHLVCYWICDSMTPSSWQLASSVIAVGLGWKDSLTITAVSYLVISVVIAFNGAIGVLYHCPFPVLARAPWGFWGSYVAIVSRVILALFWFSIHTMNGANSTRALISSLWPGFSHLPNTIPVDQGIEKSQMIAFMVFWCAQLPFLCMHPNTLRWLFVVKSIYVPIVWIGILIWAFRSTGGGGDLFRLSATLTGSDYTWRWLANMTAQIGGFSTLSVNQADFSRYSHASARWQAIYVPLLPVAFTFASFIGIAATSAGSVLYGQVIWDPNKLILAWTQPPNGADVPNPAAARAAQFFAALSFALASLGTNIAANSVSAANDLAAIAPRYVDIRRGQLVCAAVAWGLVPWRILASAGSFLNFLSAYSVFFGPLAAIMLSDFWIVKRRRYDVRELYRYQGHYHYHSGWNWRAVLAFVVGAAPTLPGLAESVNPAGVNAGPGARVFAFGWLFGFFATLSVYTALGLLCGNNASLVDVAVGPDEVYDAQAPEEGGSVAGDEGEGLKA